MLVNLKPIRVMVLLGLIGAVVFIDPIKPEAAGIRPAINANAWGILPL